MAKRRSLQRCRNFPWSADWMPCNFDRRVEAMSPIKDVSLHAHLKNVLDTCLADNRQAWALGADSIYPRKASLPGEEWATHAILMRTPRPRRNKLRRSVV